MNPFFFIRQKDNILMRINHDDIGYILAQKDYCSVYIFGTQPVPRLGAYSSRHTIHVTLKKMETILPADKFFRSHRGTIINLSKIDSIDDNAIVIHGNNLPIGGTMRTELLKKINYIHAV